MSAYCSESVDTITDEKSRSAKPMKWYKQLTDDLPEGECFIRHTFEPERAGINATILY
jgi:hypothetical protein